jgi:hypothetical protein
MAVDLSVFRKQRKLMEKRARRKSGISVSRGIDMKDEKVVQRISELESRLMEDMVMKKDIEKEMRETRQIMYIVLAVTLAIFAFLIGVLVRYIG